VSTLRAASRGVSALMIASVGFAFGLVHRGDEGPSGQDSTTCASLMRGVSAARIGRMDLHTKGQEGQTVSRGMVGCQEGKTSEGWKPTGETCMK
jgi:hypothetical protein